MVLRVQIREGHQDIVFWAVLRDDSKLWRQFLSLQSGSWEILVHFSRIIFTQNLQSQQVQVIKYQFIRLLPAGHQCVCWTRLHFSATASHICIHMKLWTVFRHHHLFWPGTKCGSLQQHFVDLSLLILSLGVYFCFSWISFMSFSSVY